MPVEQRPEELPLQDDQQLQTEQPARETRSQEPEIVEQHYLDKRGRRKPIKVKILARSNSEAPPDKAVRAHRDRKRT